MPCPILPDGTLCWLPIPEFSGIKPRLPRYDELTCGSHNLGDILRDLSKNRFVGSEAAHLDPDLAFDTRPRLKGWRPLFGQAGAALRHLENNGVGVGDIFLFFGWFRQTEQTETGLRYVRNAPDLHVIFGWMQVGEKTFLTPKYNSWPDWARNHPHIQGSPYADLDAVFSATSRLDINGRLQDLPGGGTFNNVREPLILTEKGKSRSNWLLPRAFCPRDRPPMTYHSDRSRWDCSQDDGVRIRVASRGQEFVVDLDYYPDIVSWITGTLFAPDNL